MPKQRGKAADLPDTVAVAGTALVSAFDSAGVAVIITDLDLQPPGPVVRYVNPAFEDITGYAAEEVIGRPTRLLQSPLSDQEMLPRLRQLLVDGTDYRTETLNQRKSGEEYIVEWIISPIRDEHGTPAHWIALLRDVSRERLLRHRFAAELEHRTRNLLSTVRSIASRTLREASKATIFAERLAALGRVYGLLSKAAREEAEVELDLLIRTELKAHAIPVQRVLLSGDAVPLPRSHVETLALAIHELAINALQHGALAAPDGRVSIDWLVSSAGDRLTLHWVESGAGHPVEEPLTRGYGRELIEGAMPFSLRATTQMEFRPGGLWCRIELPLQRATDNVQPPAANITYLDPSRLRLRRDDGEKSTR
jgi:PAS domain S-box-containing protein